jgi:hypothetical protein
MIGMVSWDFEGSVQEKKNVLSDIKLPDNIILSTDNIMLSDNMLSDNIILSADNMMLSDNMFSYLFLKQFIHGNMY